jgi:tetratricopeptide (TPR) repeat protein
MAYWGIAITLYHPIWAPPNTQELAAGSAAAKKAATLSEPTERERGYIAAIGVFYRDSDRLGHQARAQAYSDALLQLSKRLPDDHEAQIFYALSLLGAAPPGDANFANQKQAAAILNGLLPLEPQHPAIAHYMIHSFDYPELAVEALPAARAYSKIAPDSPHALHMPSHIFTRLGLWQDSIVSNLASAEAGRQLVARRHPGAVSMDTLHALDYLEYAYLQIDDEAAAREVLAEAAAAGTFDDPTFAAGYALAAIPARYALERRDWQAAAQLEEQTGNHPVTPGPPLPARELLGDMLLELGQPTEALAAYEASLREAPNRFNSLYGAARAAERSQNPERAREFYAALVAQCVADSPRPEVAQARKFLAGGS